jgi:hypothetical protein
MVHGACHHHGDLFGQHWPQVVLDMGRLKCLPWFFCNCFDVNPEAWVRWQKDITTLTEWPPAEWRQRQYWPTMKQLVTDFCTLFRDVVNMQVTSLKQIITICIYIDEEVESLGTDLVFAPVWNGKDAYETKVKFQTAGRQAVHAYRKPTVAQAASGRLGQATKRAHGEPVQAYAEPSIRRRGEWR